MDDYVVVCYEEQWFPGKILKVHMNSSADVMCMEYIDTFLHNNKFRWPERRKDTLNYDKTDLLLKIDPPKPVGTGTRVQHFEFDEQTFSDACTVMQ